MRRAGLLALLLLAACGGNPTTSRRQGQLACSDCTLAPDGSYLLDFGNVIVGDYVEQDVTLENRGSLRLLVDLPALAAPFSCARCGRLDLDPGQSATVTLGFGPTAAGAASADASVQGDGKAAVRFHLQGLGAEGAFTCTPERVDFGGWREGATSDARVVSCTNTGSVPLALVVQPPAPPFTTTADAQPVSVDPGRTLEIPVTFTPDHIGNHPGKLELTSAGRLQVGQVALFGTGLDHRIEVTPQPCADFGFVTVGTSRTLPVTVRNVAAAPITITEIDLEGPFTFTPRAPLTLAPAGEAGDRADLAVTFRPDTNDAQEGTLQMLTDDVHTPQQKVCLKGSGGGPTISCQPQERTFGVTAIGSPRTLTLTCTNIGFNHPDTTADGLVITGATSTDPHFAAAVRPRGPAGVGEAIVVDVTYAPDAETSNDGVLHIASSDSATPVLDVPLSGEGRTFAPCDFTLAPQALDFGRVPPGQAVQLGVRLANRGGGDCLVGDARILPGGSDAFHAGEPSLAQVLPPGEDLVVPVTYAPETAGDHQAGLGVYVNGASLQTVALQGSSAVPCLLIRPAPLDFGIVAPGCATQVRYLEVENRCRDEVTVASVSLAGSASDAFHVAATDLPFPVSAGAFHEIGLVYHPASSGAHDDLGAALVQLAGETVPWAVGLRGRAEGEPLQHETFVQHEQPTVDVLFVVDGRPGTGPMQAKLANAAVRDAFLGYAREQKIDFHVGVTSTIVGNNDACVADGRLLPLSGTRYLTGASDPDLWTTMMAPGTCAFGRNQGIQAALLAATPPLVNNEDDPRHGEKHDGNLGFLRRTAHLAVVFVSDDDDHSPGQVSDYLDELRATKGVRKGNLFSAHAVIHEPGTSCSGSVAEGTRYADLVKQTFGELASVCSADWPGNLDRIGRSAFGYEQCFELTNVPEGTGSSDGWFTLVVKGLPYPALGSHGERRWEYRAEENAVCFRPLSIPEPGVAIDVQYGVACLP